MRLAHDPEALLIVPAVAGSSGDIDGFERLLVVRGLRLFRLIRAWRMLRHFKAQDNRPHNPCALLLLDPKSDVP